MFFDLLNLHEVMIIQEVILSTKLELKEDNF